MLKTKIPDDTISGMKLAACGTLQDHLVGEEHITDYLLFWLNTHACFDYVELMGLEQPEDDGTVMLAKSAISRGKFRTARDIQRGTGTRKIPDIKYSASKFLRLFRSGQLGPVNLDTDLFNNGDGSKSHHMINRKVKVY